MTELEKQKAATQYALQQRNTAQDQIIELLVQLHEARNENEVLRAKVATLEGIAKTADTA